MTRDPSGHREADDARGQLDAGGSLDAGSRDRWSDTVPGYEFERGHPAPGHPGAHGPRGDHGPHGDHHGAVHDPRSHDRRGRVIRAEPDGEPRSFRAGPEGEPRSFRYTPVVSQPGSVPPQPWPGDKGRPARTSPPPAGNPGFDDQGWYSPPPGTGPFGAIPSGDFAEPSARRSESANQERTPSGRAARSRADQDHPARTGTPQGRTTRARTSRSRAAGSRAGRAEPWPGPDGTGADAEWASLLRSFVPEPIKRRWSSQFRAALSFRGWGVRVAIPILAAVVFGIVLVMIKGASSTTTSGPTPSPSTLGYPPATLAGSDFTAAAGGRGIDQSLSRIASNGTEIVAVGSQTGARIARAQFFVSLNGGRTWTLGTVRSASGGPPPPGHAATFVAGGNGSWVALGPGAIWTSADGRTWTLAPGSGLPLRLGDRINAVERTATGYIAVGEDVPGGQAAKATPLVFLSSDGTTWQRLDAARLHLAAGTGRVQDLTSVAAAGNQILVSGDIVTTTSTGKPARKVTVQQGGAWLSRNGGSSWLPALTSAAAPAGHGATAQITGVATAGRGFVLFRPATAAKNPAVDVYGSANGTTWKFGTTLATAIGFTPGVAGGGPGGAVITGKAGNQLTAFASANGSSWQQAGPFATTAAQAVSGATVAGGTVVTAGTGQADSAGQQPVITTVAPGRTATSVDIAQIPGATDSELAVNALNAQGSKQVAVGSANGYPAAWTSANGGASWTRATGATPTVLDRPGSQQLTGVAHGTAGWVAVGGSATGAAGHPVVVISADGGSWQAADTESAFTPAGLITADAAAGRAGYVIVGYQQTGAGAAQRTVAAAWWSAGLTGWQRAGDAAAGALDGAGAPRKMLAVTAAPDGFVAVGSHGAQPSVWTSANGRTWQQADLPQPPGATQAVLQHVASAGQAVTAVGTATTSTGVQLPFAASSSNGGRTWTETDLPQPQGPATATALTAAGHDFVVTGTYGTSPAHQDVLVWTSPNGATWNTALPTGQGMTSGGIQAITGLAASGGTLSGVGFTASPTSESPLLWQSPIR